APHCPLRGEAGRGLPPLLRRLPGAAEGGRADRRGCRPGLPRPPGPGRRHPPGAGKRTEPGRCIRTREDVRQTRMDPVTAQQPTPLRRRTATTEEFNLIPAHVFPRTARRAESGEVVIGGVSLPELAATHGTPSFVMDEADFRSRCREMAEAFGGGQRVHYASKAFISTAVCRWVAEEGLSLDVARLGELRIALHADFPAERSTAHGNNQKDELRRARGDAAAGLRRALASPRELRIALHADSPAARITVHGNNKNEEFLRAAVEAGVELIVIDSLQEVAELSRVARELDTTQDVLVRVTPG